MPCAVPVATMRVVVLRRGRLTVRMRVVAVRRAVALRGSVTMSAPAVIPCGSAV
jgi:hypothetical protein